MRRRLGHAGWPLATDRLVQVAPHRAGGARWRHGAPPRCARLPVLAPGACRSRTGRWVQREAGAPGISTPGYSGAAPATVGESRSAQQPLGDAPGKAPQRFGSPAEPALASPDTGLRQGKPASRRAARARAGRHGCARAASTFAAGPVLNQAARGVRMREVSRCLLPSHCRRHGCCSAARCFPSPRPPRPRPRPPPARPCRSSARARRRRWTASSPTSWSSTATASAPPAPIRSRTCCAARAACSCRATALRGRAPAS